MQTRHKVQVLADLQLTVKRWRFRQVADVCFGLYGIGQQINIANADFTGTGRQITGQHLHSSCLAGAVGAEQTKDFATAHVKIDGVDSDMCAKAAGQTPGANGQSGVGWIHQRLEVYCPAASCLVVSIKYT